MSVERRPIPGYEGYYEADADGNIWSLGRTVNGTKGPRRLKERKLKPVMNSNGYLNVNLCANGKRRTKSAHRLVGAAFGLIELSDSKQKIDHIDHNPLNNRLSNLRAATDRQNKAHGGSSLMATNTSGFRGVSWHNASKRWVVYIGVNNKNLNLGYFTCRIAAALAYDDAAVEHFGEFANLNFDPQKLVA